MEISWKDKLTVLVRALRQTPRLPTSRQKLAHLLCPVDSVRYTEFAYILRSMREREIKPREILDVSSPFVLAYILSDGGSVVKTDINPAEAKYIRKSNGLCFKQENATQLDFDDESFDLVYSISVIEHIYGGYSEAVREMLRVLRPGGYLFLTFPVAPHHFEEWLDETIYSHQHTHGGRVFFEYRFDENDVKELVNGLGDSELIDLSIYWEKRNGECDRTMELLRKRVPVKLVHELRKALINLCAGFTLLDNLPENFTHERSCGIACVLLRKRLQRQV